MFFYDQVAAEVGKHAEDREEAMVGDQTEVAEIDETAKDAENVGTETAMIVEPIIATDSAEIAEHAETEMEEEMFVRREGKEEMLLFKRRRGKLGKFIVRLDNEALLQNEESLFLELIFDEPDMVIPHIQSNLVFGVDDEHWDIDRPEDIPVLRSSMIKNDETELVGSSHTLLIEDVDEAEARKEKELQKILKEREQKEEEFREAVVKAATREKTKNRYEVDPDFRAVFDRLMRYEHESADELFYENDEVIIKRCFKQDLLRVEEAISQIFKSNESDNDLILTDLQMDVSTLPLATLKDFLRRHGFTSFNINKMSIEKMYEEAKKAQLCILKKIPRDQAEMMLDSGRSLQHPSRL